ncbi:MAG: Gfo/Idh/MocA family oxidoreductase [Clostridiales bacterium]|jgi:predicted dehydrogenase|nr:Gfo/Idh/MocA family oxidoreductase [Clostridiales bacterium]
MKQHAKQATGIRALVIGCGAIAPLHVAGIRAAGGEVSGLCDTVRPRAEELRLRRALTCAVFTDYKEAIEAVKPDVVHICTPHDLHAEMCVYALERDIHVLCEKPLAISTEEIEAIQRTEENSKATLCVCLQNRCRKTVERALEAVRGSRLTAASAQLLWARDKAYYLSSPWRGKWRTEGGSLLINQAIHTLDLLTVFTGVPAAFHAAVYNHSLQGIIETEDTAVLQYTHLGTKATFFGTNAAGHSFPVELKFITDKRAVTLCGDELFIDGRHIENAKTEGEILGKDYWGVGHSILIRAYYASLTGAGKNPVDIRAGTAALRLILQIYGGRLRGYDPESAGKGAVCQNEREKGD